MMKTKMMQRPETATFSEAALQALRKRVAEGESETLEFKRKANYPDKIVREMIAFANTKGGTLLIGVSDEGNISGLKFPDEDAYAMRKALKRCRPQLRFKEQLIPIAKNKYILSYEIAESKRKPHFIVLNRFKKISFIRVADKSMKASREMLAIVRLQKNVQGVQFSYGDEEQKLFKFLHTQPHITLQEFIQLTQLSYPQASQKLITLVLANVLTITPTDRGDRYALRIKT